MSLVEARYAEINRVPCAGEAAGFHEA